MTQKPNVTQNTSSISSSAGKQFKSRTRSYEVWRLLKKNRGAIISLVIIVILILASVFADVLFDYSEMVIKQNISQRMQRPSFAHFFGTDDLGRDILARVIHGGRISLAIGFMSTLVGAIIGVFFGAIAGYSGGAIENIIMRIADIFVAIPANLLAVVVVAALGASEMNLMIAISICNVPKMVRVARSSVMTTRNMEYIEAERAIGASDLSIIFKTALPNSLSMIFVNFTLTIATSITTVSAMSFIGLGIPAPRPEWGSMLSAGRLYLRDYSYMTFFPGLAIMITILSFNMLGDGLRDALDVRAKR